MTYIIIFLTVIVSIAALRNRTLFDRLSLVPYRVRPRPPVVAGYHARLRTRRLCPPGREHVRTASFGQFIERFFGAYQQIGLVSNGDLWYLLLYFGGMVAASVYDLIRYRNNPRYASIGASGAVSAVVFASIFFNPWSKIYLLGVIPIPGIIFGLLYIGYSSYMGRRQGDRINHFAHLFGALFGFLFPLLMNPSFFSVFWDNLTK